MDNIAFIDGEFKLRSEAKTNIEDRGYQFSDGVYEVVYIKKSILIDWDLHCLRLTKSLSGIRIPYEIDSDILKETVNELIKKNKIVEGFLYLQITRGVAKRNHLFASSMKPSISMTVDKIAPKDNDLYSKGIKAISLPDLRWKLRHLKTISLLPNVLAKQEAVDKGASEALFVEDDGFVTEGSTSNFFIVDYKDNLVTHPANQRILGGITRDGVIKVAKKNDINVIEAQFTIQDAINSKECFFTSTTKHILPVSTIDNKTIGGGKCGQTTSKLINLYQKYIQEQL